MKGQRGFTLIEMAVVLAIIGLIIGGGIMAVGPVIDKARTNQTNATLDQIENALVLFAIRNNRLPCPAFGSTSNSSAAYGQEQTTTPGTTDCSLSGNGLADSVIPWRTLGLDETYSVDGWGNRISYFPASSAVFITAGLPGPSLTLSLCMVRNVSSAQTAFRPTTCDPANTLSAGSIGTYKNPTYPFGAYIPLWSLLNTSTELTGGANQSPITDTNVSQAGIRAAYVLISHGKSGWYGWNKAGNQIKATGNGSTAKLGNSTATAGKNGAFGFVQGPPNPTNTTAFFDDIVRWRSPGMIIQLCGSGACGNP